ncbi:MAG TPA: bifunctional (p)ppGpp synthetase/guanosine-3',5'-bis(diphosphate) 3'-pyrophosphohydrolase [Candidatus Krumholzibacteria bacterium]|nr:bifunctional (p)ppGpp synthetase/guanosine-3',5'-bis(diphosphate) 3'-pyrophosphohydrolase [Candidatus Krumholzibacteria bacterium]
MNADGASEANTLSQAQAEQDELRALLVPYMPEPERELVDEAFDFAKTAHLGQMRHSGLPYFSHVVEVAKTLARMRLDHEAVAAGLLHDVLEDTQTTAAQLEERFGAGVSRLVDGVTKIGRVHFESAEQAQAENFRKMLLSMIQDVRIILVKLADRLHNMKTLEFVPEPRRRLIAQETLDIYAPLAHRMGIGFLKWQLEDLAFKHLEPEAYRDIENEIGLKRQEREGYLEQVSRPIRDKLTEAGIHSEVSGRAKHFYSIHKKMRGRNKAMDELYDLLALRVVVPSLRDCYSTLGILHTLYTPIHDRFKDYIATPKSNMYRSLHTTVMGPGGHYIEIQIRTDEMHRTNEYGIAAHWKYKEEGRTDEELDTQLQWLRQMLEEKQELRDPREFLDALKIDLFQHEVFVFTPRGDLKQLPSGSTPIDFAFAVHTQVGTHATGARVNGRMVPLHTELHSGDTVDILTAPTGHPSLGWLQIARTARARSKVRHWLNTQRYAESVALGREMLEREIKGMKAKFDLEHDLTDLAMSIGFEDAEKLLAALGQGTQSLKAVVNRILPRETKGRLSRLLPTEKVQRLVRGSTEGIRVQGVGNLMVRFAHCCGPVPGDRIQGVVTRGRGISVHRQDCVNLDAVEADRRIDVSWDVGEKTSFLARLCVTGEDRKNLLADISKKISATGTNIQSGDFASVDGLVRVSFIIEVNNLRQLNEVMRTVKTVQNVRRVTRGEDH